MAQIHKLESQTLLKCSADKFFDTWKNNVLQIPKLLPENYKSIQVLEGDGKSVGTVRLWKFVQGDTPTALATKDRLEAVDDKNRSMTFSIFGGDLMNLYENFVLKLSVTPKGGNGSEGGCLVKWCAEYEKKTEDVPPPNGFIDLAAKLTKTMDAHLLKA